MRGTSSPMSEGALIIAVLVLAGWLLIELVWGWSQRRTHDADAAERRASLLRELRRHDR